MDIKGILGPIRDPIDGEDLFQSGALGQPAILQLDPVRAAKGSSLLLRGKSVKQQGRLASFYIVKKCLQIGIGAASQRLGRL